MSCTAAEGQEVCGSVLLQTGLQVALKNEGPLTASLGSRDFSEVVVPINAGLLVAVVVFFCLVLLHEACVEAGAKPLLASREGRHSAFLQCAFLVSWLAPYILNSMMIPVSLDFALAMGQSATASGVFIGSLPVGATIGIMLGKNLVREEHWDQRHARRLFVFAYGFQIVVMPGIALLTQSSALWSQEAKRVAFWLIVGLAFLCNAIGNTCIISWMTMWNIITPQSQKTFWSMLAQCSKNLGFIAGPVFFAIVSYLARSSVAGQAISPISMMSWVFMGMFLVQAIELTVAALIFPVAVPPENEQDVANAEGPEEEVAEVQPEDLNPAAREQIVWNMIYYSYERAFTISAIEVATIMLLEVSYGWSNELTGLSFVVIAAGSVSMTVVSAVCLSHKLMTDSMIFLTFTFLGLLGCILLFDFHHFGAGSLLVADVIVYGGASVANGIGEGWACRAATKGTRYNIEFFRAHNIGGVCISRFLAPIIARFLLDYGGRNLYAVLQMTLCIMATSTVYHTVTLVWMGHGADLNPATSENADANLKPRFRGK